MKIKSGKRKVPRIEVESWPLTGPPGESGVYLTLYQDAEGYAVLDLRYYGKLKEGGLRGNIRGVLFNRWQINEFGKAVDAAFELLNSRHDLKV